MPEPVDAARLIAHLGLHPLPVEGTLFRRTYTSATRLADGRAAGSAIIGVIAREPASGSRLHRVSCDEMWHFYGGGPFRLLMLHPDGSSEDCVLGPDLLAGHRVQVLVPAGSWQAVELLDGSDWALYGCTVTPEFTEGAFEGGRADDLLASHPDRRADILRLAVPDDSPVHLPPGSAGQAGSEP